jgi:hypothetical protein
LIPGQSIVHSDLAATISYSGFFVVICPNIFITFISDPLHETELVLSF